MTNSFQLTETFLYKRVEGAVTEQFLRDIGNETLWVSQKTVAEVFGTIVENISIDFINIFDEGELDENKVSINVNDLFKDQREFSKESLLNSKKGDRAEKCYNIDGII